MSSNIRDPFVVEFGSIVDGSTVHEIVRYLLIITDSDDGRIQKEGGDDHFLDCMLAVINAFCDEVDTKVFDFSDGTVSGELAKLGAMIRRKLEGDSLLNHYRGQGVNVFVKGEEVTYDGRTYRTHSETTDDKMSFPDLFAELWSIVGSELTHIFGKWDRTKHIKQDDATAGMFALSYFVSTKVTWWLGTLSKFYKGMVEFDKTSGQGTRVAFSKSKPSTWNAQFMSHLMKSNKFVPDGTSDPNGTFGNFLEDDINDSDLRTSSIPVVEHALDEINNPDGLWTTSKWTWRFGRTIEAVPLYFPYNNNIEERFASTHNLASAMFPFANYDSKNWNIRKFITFYRETINRIKDTYFLSNILGGLKAYFVDKKFYDLAEEHQGYGGLAWFVTTHMQDSKIGSKFVVSPANYDTNKPFALQERREATNVYRFEAIGQIPQSLYMKIYALNVIYFKGDVNEGYKQQQTDIGGTVKQIVTECCGFVCQSISRSEGTGLRIGESDVWFSAHSDFDEGTSDSVKPWKFNTTRDTVTYIGEVFEERDALYAGRRVKDPLKKLAHTYPDLNWFDVDKIRNIHVALWLPNAKVVWSEGQDDDGKPNGKLYPSGIARRADHVDKSGKEWFKKSGEDKDAFMKRVYPSGIPEEESSSSPSALSGGQTLVPGRMEVTEGDDSTPPKTKDNDPNESDNIESQHPKPDARYDDPKHPSGVDETAVSAKKEEAALKKANEEKAKKEAELKAAKEKEAKEKKK
jgi:hypothetical protein